MLFLIIFAKIHVNLTKLEEVHNVAKVKYTEVNKTLYTIQNQIKLLQQAVDTNLQKAYSGRTTGAVFKSSSYAVISPKLQSAKAVIPIMAMEPTIYDSFTLHLGRTIIRNNDTITLDMLMHSGGFTFADLTIDQATLSRINPLNN